jgi:hypothetical protein
MLGDETYRQWADVFSPGSYYEGSWDKGTEIRFIGSDDTGASGGMLGTVVENRPDEFVSVEYSGMVIEGVPDTTSDAAKQMAGTRESYSFSETDGVTTVIVEMDSDDDYVEMLEEAWPVALGKLRELSESFTNAHA